MRPTIRTTVTAIVVFGAALGGTAVANHQFSDVPDSNAFHDEISEFAGAGCADGFPDGTFHPTDAVKRQQMARFFTRCAGRVVSDTGGATVTTSGTLDTLAGATLTAPADGFVLVNASASAIVTGPNLSACPCLAQIDVFDGSSSSQDLQDDVSPAAPSTGNADANLAQTHVFTVAQGDTRTYSVRGGFVDDNLVSISFNGEITALFVPFTQPAP